MAETLISNQTGAANSRGVHVPPGEAVTIVLTGTYGANENADISVSYDGGVNFSDYYYGGSQIRLNNTDTSVNLIGPLVFRIEKEATASTAGAVMSTRDNM